jgi:hypothetical protein
MNDTVTGQKNMGSLSTWDLTFPSAGLKKESYAELADQYKDPYDSKKVVWGDPTGMVPSYAEGNITSDAKGTTARANGGKPKWHLLPMHLFEGVVRVLEFGAKKYATWNWTKGSPYSTPFDCAIRHLFKFYWLGEDLDPETGEHHLDHAITNLLFLRHYTKNYKEGDDRPVKNFGSAK